MNYLSLCAIARNEERYIEEWLCFHRAVGVEHFYIYDNDSKRPLKELLAGQPDVTLKELGGSCRQLDAYNDCHSNHGSDSRWIGMIDVDEFVVPHATDNLAAFLSDYERFGGLALNWQMFGPNGHQTRPAGLVIENYTMKARSWARMNWHIKTIAQPQMVDCWGHVHYPIYRDKHVSVNASFRPVVKTAFCWPRVGKIQLNHYWTKSRQDWAEKMRRGRADIGQYDEKTARKIDGFARSCKSEDRSACRFAAAVKASMAAARMK